MPGGGHRAGAGPPGPALVYLVDRGEPAAVPAVVEYQPEGGEPIPVTRVEVSTGLDVAVLHLQRPAPAVLPAAGQVTAGEQWRVETRPDPGAPVLRGTVTEPHRQLRNAAGKETTLIQLWVEQDIGGYQGYSGSPVIAAVSGRGAGGARRAGTLADQRPARREAAGGQRAVRCPPRPGGGRVRSRRGAGRKIGQGHTPAGCIRGRRPDQLDQVMDALTGAVTGWAAGGAGRHGRQRQIRAGRGRSP